MVMDLLQASGSSDMFSWRTYNKTKQRKAKGLAELDLWEDKDLPHHPLRPTPLCLLASTLTHLPSALILLLWPSTLPHLPLIPHTPLPLLCIHELLIVFNSIKETLCLSIATIREIV